MRRQLEIAVRLTLATQIRNRLAWVLLVTFVPVWYLLIGSMISHGGTGFRLRATGTDIVVDGHDLTLITAGLSAITLITGFVVFAAVRRSRPSTGGWCCPGYRHSALITAKTTAALARPWASAPTPQPSCWPSGGPPGSGPSRWRSSWARPPTPRSAC